MNDTPAQTQQSGENPPAADHRPEQQPPPSPAPSNEPATTATAEEPGPTAPPKAWKEMDFDERAAYVMGMIAYVVELFFRMVFAILTAPFRAFAGMVQMVTDGLLKGLVVVFRLKPFETPLYTKSVAVSLEIRGLLLACVAGLEWYIWSRVFRNSLADSPWRHVLTAVFVATIVALDRMILMLPTLEVDERLFLALREKAWPRFVAAWGEGKGLEAFGVFAEVFGDWWVRTSKSRVSLQRFALVCVFATINATTAVMSLVSSEIELHLQAKESVALTHLRDVAESDVHARYTNLQAREAERLNADLAAWDAAHTPAARAAEEARRRTRLQELQRIAAEKQALARQETQRVVGGRSTGPDYDRLARDADQAQAAVAEYEREMNAALTDYDNENRRGHEQRSQAAGTAVTTLEARERAEIEQARTMDPDTLAARYSVTWRISRGFMSQYQAFGEIRRADTHHDLDGFLLAAEFMLGALSICILFVSKTNPIDLNLYLSPAARAAAGSEPDQLALTVRYGVKDFPSFALSDNVRTRLELGHKLCRKVVEALTKLDKETTRLAREKNPHGWHLSHEDIQGQLQNFEADEVIPKIDALVTESRTHEAHGLGAIPWPSAYAGIPDPRFPLPRPRWEINADELTKRGWVDPAPQRAEFGRLRETYRSYQLDLIHMEGDWEERMLSAGRDGLTRGAITALSQNFFRSQVAATLLELAQLDTRFAEKGLTPPAWVGGQNLSQVLKAKMVDDINFRWLSRSTSWEEPAGHLDSKDLREEEPTAPRRRTAPPPTPARPAPRLPEAPQQTPAAPPSPPPRDPRPITRSGPGLHLIRGGEPTPQG